MTESSLIKLQLTKRDAKPHYSQQQHSSSLQHSPRKSKPILRTKQPSFTLVHNGRNATPKFINPEVYTLAKERQMSVFDIYTLETSSLASSERAQSTVRFKTRLMSENVGTSQYYSTINRNIDETKMNFADLLEVFQQSSSQVFSESISESSEEIVDKDSKKIDRPVMVRPTPKHVSLTLNETETIILLDLPSCTVLKDTEEGELVEEQNKEYEYLTHGKGRNRKVLQAEVQTVPILQKTRDTISQAVRNRNDFTFASNWEMYDTYKQTLKAATSSSEDSDESSDEDVHGLDDASSIESYRLSSDEKHLSKLMKNVRFMDAICVTERLLANNYFNEQQKRFRGLSDPDDFREDIEYKYRLNLLWTFANDSTKGRCVTTLEWNPVNKDLLAVGYGKFYFMEVASGMVLIWNIKNPVQPERKYDFKQPVTTLSFSKKDPNLLAVGFLNGHLIVINVVNRDIQIIAENTPTYDQIRHVSWHFGTEHRENQESIYATSECGSVNIYSLGNSKQLESQQIMRVAKADGKLKGYDPVKKCSNLSIPVSRYASALLLRPHPVDQYIYFVATNEGVIHKCSTHYFNQHLDLFLAHDGPINDIKYSPFSNIIYATCGDDWHLRIWAEGIAEPLHELFVTMQSVQGMDWCPTHSTILVSIYGKTILLWDFQRKVFQPQSVTQSPTNSRNTVVEFIDSGRCLVVGDIDGNVHVFSLEDMPFPAFFQENLLYRALRKSLITKPDLLNKLMKLVRAEKAKQCAGKSETVKDEVLKEASKTESILIT